MRACRRKNVRCPADGEGPGDQGLRRFGAQAEKVEKIAGWPNGRNGRIAPVGRTAVNGRTGGVPARRRKLGLRPERAFTLAVQPVVSTA